MNTNLFNENLFSNLSEKRIYTKRVAYELRKRGFKILRVEPNENKPEFDVWIFEVTPKFTEALTAITQEYYQNKYNK